MKIKNDFIARKVGQKWYVVAVDQASVTFNKMLTLNETVFLLWNRLEKGSAMEDLVQTLTAEYEVDEAQAKQDALAIVTKFRELGCLEDDE